jgi:hypothetical protein
VGALWDLGLTLAEIQQLTEAYLTRPGERDGPRLAAVITCVRARTEAQIAELRGRLARIDDFERQYSDELAGRADFRAQDPRFSPRGLTLPVGGGRRFVTEVMTVPHANLSDTKLAPEAPVDGPRAARPVPVNARPVNACRPGLTWRCKPPDLPADTNLTRVVDRVVPRRGGGYLLYWGVILAIRLGLAPHLPVRSRLAF